MGKKRKPIKVNTRPTPSQHDPYPRHWDAAMYESYKRRAEEFKKRQDAYTARLAEAIDTARRHVEQVSGAKSVKDRRAVEIKRLKGELRLQKNLVRLKDREIRILERKIARINNWIELRDEDLQSVRGVLDSVLSKLQTTIAELRGALQGRLISSLEGILAFGKRTVSELEDTQKQRFYEREDRLLSQFIEDEMTFQEGLEGLQASTPEEMLRMKSPQDNAGAPSNQLESVRSKDRPTKIKDPSLIRDLEDWDEILE